MRRLFSYYFYPFIFLLPLLLLHALTGESIHSFWENILIAVVFALTGALLIGTLTYLYDTRWGPNKRTRLFSKPLFKALEHRGFRRRDDFVWRTVNGYTVLVSFTWESGKDAINVQVLFDPRTVGGQFLTRQELKEVAARNKPSGFFHRNPHQWERNGVGCLLEYSFILPTVEKVMEVAQELIAILERERLKPISLEETEKVLPYLQEWIKERKEEQSVL